MAGVAAALPAAGAILGIVLVAGLVAVPPVYRLPFSVILLLLLMIARERRRTADRERALLAANAAVARAEASFRGVFESSTDVLCTYRIVEGGAIRLENFNPAAARFRNLDATAHGRLLEEILPADLVAEARGAIEGVAATGAAKRLERQFVSGHRDGDRRDMEVIVTPLPRPGAAIDHVFVSIRDISHLRRAQAAVARSEALHRTIAESTSDMILRLDVPDLRCVYASPASRTLLDVEPDALTGRPACELVHDDDRAAVAESAAAALAAGASAGGPAQAPQPVAYRIRRADGRWLWVEASMSASRDAGGLANGLICSIRDIDARRRAEAARTSSEARFRLLAENASELIMLSHDDGRRSYISPASLRLVGFTPAELQAEMDGRRWAHPDDVGQLARTELLPDADTAVSCRVRHKDGSWIWVEAFVRRIPISLDGEPTIIATFRNVTERQAQAQALREAKDAADRARCLAEQASRAKSEFLATMSHEIRTPLNAVLGFADLLDADFSLRPGSRRYLDRIRRAGATLRAIVDDILDFSKFEAGELRLESLPFRPGALVEDAAAMMRGLAEHKGLTLTAALDAALPALLVGDQQRIRQVLINLLNNAVKFTRQGSIALDVTACAASPGAAGEARVRLRFSVSDTGIGIPAEKLGRVFQRFSQVDGSVSREYGGTGLGLAICRSLVEAMGGSIDVESVVERGSTFWFELVLPLADAAGGDGREPSHAADEAEAALFDDFAGLWETCGSDEAARAAAAQRPLDILLVEDVLLNQELNSAILAARGHRIDVVGNGSEAIMAVADKHYDLVLMDLQMPHVDGIAATRAIRLLPGSHRFVAIVALTAAVLREQTDAALAAGMNGVLTKPLSLADLDEVLERAGRDDLRGPADPSAFDPEVADGLLRILGGEKVRRMSALLETSLASRFTVPLTQATKAALQFEAHASIAGTAMLGFTRFGGICRAFVDADDASLAACHAALIDELFKVARILQIGQTDADRCGTAAVEPARLSA